VTTRRDGRSIASEEDVRRALTPLTRLGDDATALDVLRSALADQTIRLVSHDRVVRLGKDPEGVHQARVAARRLRSDLRMFRPLLDRDWAEALRVELEWLSGLLGPVRDADVLRGRLQERIEGMTDPEPVSGKVLLDVLDADLARGRRRLLEGLRSQRYAELLERLASAAHRPLPLDGDDRGPAKSLGSLMERPWESLARRARRLGPDAGDGALHAVRIRAKRVRYGAETLAPVFGKRASRFAAAAEDLQKVLGDHQDSVVATGWLAEHSAETHDPAAAFTAGRLAELELSERRRARDAWPKAWKRLEQRKRFWT
jgi:CHAD domain-containing protein